ncbi:sensor histidine kinase [Bacillus sp. T33-2]|uniref:sensor histidine kinase n=1 Tax=Bacillus sp. T33-2 TaxID=2054168 RepID=UPI001C60A743|nr:histidine kinase [Bacillus sp. T33-2]
MILISILGPVVGVFILIFYTSHERQVYVLEMQNQQISLEKELEISRYLQLNQQIQPHFFFNALNSLLGLIRLKQYDRLYESFEHMAVYLRSKYTAKEPLYPLEKEVSYTESYLEIQKLRFGHRLTINWEIEKGLEQAMVIPYLLQTLVENAFKHGLEMIEEQAELLIKINSLEDGRIQMIVADNGPGFPDEIASVPGEQKVGLQNIRRRLGLLFANEAVMTAKTAPGKQGAVVQVIWPKVTIVENGGEHL